MQLKLDLTNPKVSIVHDSKTVPVAFRAGEDFKEDLLKMAKAKNIDLSELLFEYVLNGYVNDYKNLLLIQSNGSKTVAQLLNRQ